MIKREIWDSLDAGWRRAFRKTMRRWMRHAKEGGRWTEARAGCFLCAESRRRGGATYCTNCPVADEVAQIGVIMRQCACEDVPAYRKWEDKNSLTNAKAVLRYLCGFPPISDATRQAAEELLARRKAG